MIILTIGITRLLACLPVSFSKVLAAYQALVGPLAAYGWISRKPPACVQEKLHTALSGALGTNRMANKHIRRVVYAASTHLDSILLQRHFRRVCRMRAVQGLRWNSNPFGAAHFLRRYMQSHGWQETGPWQWKDPDDPRNIIKADFEGRWNDLGLACHQLRHRWRQNALWQWINGNRHEAVSWRTSADESSIKQELASINLDWVRNAALKATGAERAVLLGSAVSPAWLHKGKPSEPSSCPSCGAEWADLHHILWTCPCIETSLPLPQRYLSARFGWPARSDPDDLAWDRLRHMGNRVAEMWRVRHGTA